MSNTTTPGASSSLSGIPTLPSPHAFDDLHRITVDEYERLADAGVLEDRRVELINGWLVRKMTTKPPHVVAVDAALESIAGLLPNGWWLREEKPIRIPDFDEPEPDFSVVRGSRQDYRTRHPGPGEIDFLIEVSDCSLSWDRGEKLSAYARAGVPTYWILNLVDRHLEIYSDPKPTGYLDCQITGPAGQARVVIDHAEVGVIAVADLLP